MNKIYLGSGYPEKFGVDKKISALQQHAYITTDVSEAELFIFPVLYEILFEYTELEYQNANFYPEEIIQLRRKLQQMEADAVRYKKKIIVFYYQDSVKKLSIKNAVVFRTSLLKSDRTNEYALPAFVNDVREKRFLTAQPELLEKTSKPTVGFRGQSAPIVLPAKLALKKTINDILKATASSTRLNLHYNFGYLARRAALKSCLKNSKIQSDISITTLQQSFGGEEAKELFFNNLFGNQYNICASGHGNYSFRLYETLSAGRIPVFIDTNCVLPFEEFIAWRKHVVWVEENDANKADKIILDFHHSIHPDDFLQLQSNNRQLWEQYLSTDGFYQQLYSYYKYF